MLLAWNIIKIVLIVIAAIFVLTFTIYFFDLDMKLVHAVLKPLNKHYDKMPKKRNF